MVSFTECESEFANDDPLFKQFYAVNTIVTYHWYEFAICALHISNAIVAVLSYLPGWFSALELGMSYDILIAKPH